VRFWDASAIVPLLVTQKRSAEATRLRRDDAEMAVWWGSKVECTSALVRLLREDAVDRSDAAAAFERLHAIEDEWFEVEPSAGVREQACLLLKAHPIRASDALQLAAALGVATELGERLTMVCYDRRLADAARAERIEVLGAAR
jgi:predicted nucleic acid-binding protein